MEPSGYGSVLLSMKGRRVYLAAEIIGLVWAVVGVLESYRLFRLISLEREGKCDWMPCADAGTYRWLAVFLALAAIGAAVVVVVLLRQRKSRS
jgi:hypothetical protein